MNHSLIFALPPAPSFPSQPSPLPNNKIRYGTTKDATKTAELSSALVVINTKKTSHEVFIRNDTVKIVGRRLSDRANDIKAEVGLRLTLSRTHFPTHYTTLRKLHVHSLKASPPIAPLVHSPLSLVLSVTPT